MDKLAGARWRKTSYSSPNQGNCIEVADNLVSAAGIVGVRDSKDKAGPALTFSPGAWQSFVGFAKR